MQKATQNVEIEVVALTDIRPPQIRPPLTDLQKNCCLHWQQLPIPNLMQICPRGVLGKCLKYNQFFIYLYPLFWELTCRSDQLADFRVEWCKRRGLAKKCAFGGLLDTAVNLGVIFPTFGAKY